MALRAPTPEELAELDGAPSAPKSYRAPTAAELAELEAPRPTATAGRPSAAELALAEPADEVPSARAAPGEPRVATGQPALANPNAHTKGETAALGTLEGLTGGFFDEAHGVLSAPTAAHASLGGLPPADYSPANATEVLGDLFSGKIDEDAKRKLASGPLPSAESFGEGYRHRRDELRGTVADNRAENPGTAVASEIVGSLASPINELGPGVAKGAGVLSNIGRGAARAAVQGGTYAAGSSDADLTRLDPEEAKRFAKDVAIGTGAGTVVGAAGEGAGQLVRGAANWLKGDLNRRILNEVAEGTANVSTTGRKRLDSAGEAIVKEVVEGEDGKAVRKAFNGPAAKGREELKPIIEKVAQRNDAAYEAFEKAGRSKVDPDLYGLFLLHAADAADAEGQTRLAAGIRQVQKNSEALAERTKGLTLPQLRGFTTEVQGQASSVLGSLNEHANAKTALQVQAVATKAMDDMLSLAAAGDQKLTDAANTIRANNERFHALLTIDDGLRLRAYKEGSIAGPITRAAKVLGGSTAGAVAGSMAGGDDDKFRNTVLGALAGAGLTAGAKRVENAITTASIAGARGQLPRLAAAEAGAGFAARAATRAAAAPAPQDDPATKLFRLARDPKVTEEDVIKQAAALGIDADKARNIMRAMRLSREPVGQP